MIAKAVKAALFGGIAASLAITAPVATAAEEGEEAERMVVTGSRIKRVDIEGANPVTVVGREDILESGMTNVGELLQRLPEVTGSPLNTTVNNGGNGAVTLDIRGLGRTLVLVNGRRTPDGGDFQTIPAGMIERVEIYKDGASAVYGSDAMAGVVNIITRKDFTGAQAQIQVSDSFEATSGQSRQISLIFGAESEKGHFVAGIDRSIQESILQSQTPWNFMHNSYYVIDPKNYLENGWDAGVNVSGFGSSRIPNGNFNLPANSPIRAALGCPSVTYDPTLGPTTAASSYRCYNGDWSDPNNDSYNYAPVNFLQTPYERTNVFVEAGYDINDSHRLYSEFRVNKRTSSQKLAPTPFDTGSDPGYLVNVVDAAGNVVGTANGISAQNYYNPFGEDVVRLRRRMLEADRIFSQDITQYQYVLGVTGELSDAWEYDLSYNRGSRSRIDHDGGQYSGSRLASALGPSGLDSSGNIVCGTPNGSGVVADADIIPRCVPLNVFGGEGTVTPEMLKYISATLVDSSKSDLTIWNGVVSGDLFDMPAGTVGAAFGFEHRTVSSDFTPDSAKAQGEVTGNKSAPVGGTYSNTSYFAEVNLPLLSDAPAAKLLELNVGARYDDYSTGFSNTSTQLGFRWQPIDGLLVRGTRATNFRGPGIGELYSPQQDGFPQAEDPCRSANWANLSSTQQANCQADGVPAGGWNQTDTQLLTKSGGNPNLLPEEGDSYTFGVAWSPGFLDGFTVTADYWNIEIDNVISSLSASSLLAKCADFGECSAINRNFDGSVKNIVATTQNLGKRDAKGIDLNLEYGFSNDIGNWNFNLLFSRLLQRDEYETMASEPWEVAGTYDDKTVGGAYPKTKAAFTAGLKLTDWSFNYTANYVGAMDANFGFFGKSGVVACTGSTAANPTCFTVDAQLYHDLATTYNTDFGTSVSFGITNIADKAPPFIDTAFNASTDPSTYRLFGRSYFLRLTHDF